MLLKQLRVLKLIGEVGREVGLDGRENGLDGRQKNSMMGERGSGRMIVHVEMMSSSSLPPCVAIPSKANEIVERLKGGVAVGELTRDSGLLEERSVREEVGELYGVRAWSAQKSSSWTASLCPVLAFVVILTED